jgi:hypothetical protein
MPSGNAQTPIDAATATCAMSTTTNHGSLVISPLNIVMDAPSGTIANTKSTMRDLVVNILLTV